MGDPHTTLVTLFLLLFCAYGVCDDLSFADEPATAVYEWQLLNFTFPNADAARAYMENKHYTSCMPAGVKVASTGDVFVTVPRWKANVPATLNKLVAQDNEILLQPFPSWAMNAVGDSNALQSVLGLEIDQRDRLWVLDQGKVAGKEAAEGTIKLLVFDLRKGGELIRKHVFAREIASPVSSFLNDLVVDTDHEFVFITDSGINVNDGEPTRGGLLVYDFSNDESWRVLHDLPETNDDPDVWVKINDELVFPTKRMRTGADGIALSPDLETLYWCPLTARKLYKIPTSVLRDKSVVADDVRRAVVLMGSKGMASDGLGCASDGTLYMTDLEANRVCSYNPTTPLTPDVVQTVASNADMIWPDTLALDNRGRVYFVTNQLHHFVQDELDFETPGVVNFRIWMKEIPGLRAYTYPMQDNLDCPKDEQPSASPSLGSTAAALISIGAATLSGLVGFMLGLYYVRRRHGAVLLENVY